MTTDLLDSLLDDPLLANVPVHEGYKVLGGVVLYQKLGRGGMGAVYKGRHLRLDIDVALKVTALPPGTPPERSEDFVKRFIREARTAAAVRHPNLIRVYDVNAEAGVHYLIMDYVEGESAADRLERRGASGEGRLSEQEAVEICLGAAEGLAAAHSQGIVHRDVKPDNILIDKKGSVVVADLGLAKAFGAGEGDAALSMGISLTQQAMGTPYYMSPEQTRSAKDVGPAADVWSLGVTLYQLVSGELPWRESDITDLINRIRNDPPPDVKQRCDGLSDGLCRIIERALKKEPGERYADCGEMARALRGHLDSLGADVKATLEPEADAVSLAPASIPLPPPETMTLIAQAALAETPPTVDMGESVASTDSPPSEPAAPREEAVSARIRRAQQAIVKAGADSRVSEAGFLRANELMQKARERAGDCAFDEAERFLEKVEEALGHVDPGTTRARKARALALTGVAIGLLLALSWGVMSRLRTGQGLSDTQPPALAQTVAAPGDVSGLIERAKEASKKGDRGTAVRLLDQAIGLDPRNAAAHFWRGEVERSRAFHMELVGKDELGARLHRQKAIGWYDKAITLAPAEATYYATRGAARRGAGDVLGAAADLDRAIALDPGCAYAYFLRSSLRRGKGALTEARQDLDRAIALDPANAGYHSYRALQRSFGRDFEGAIQDYGKAIELEPRNSHHFSCRGDAKAQLGEYDDAIGDYDKAIQLAPSTEYYYVSRADAYLRRAAGLLGPSSLLLDEAPTEAQKRMAKQDIVAAIGDYSKAISINPAEARYHALRAWARIQQRDWGQAVVDCNRAIEIDPHCKEAYFNRAWARGRMGDKQGAKLDMERYDPELLRTLERNRRKNR